MTDPIEQCLAHLRRQLRRQGRSREDAEDLIQEAYLRLHAYCRDHEVHQLRAFLSRTVANLSVDLHRKERRGLCLDAPVESLALVDARPTPDEEAAVRERLIKARAVLEALNPRTREAFLMHRLDGYSCAQIAGHLQISVSAVEKHIARAVLALMDVAEI